MALAATSTRELAELIQPRELARQGFAEPSRVSVIFGTDHSGEEAYYVYLVFPDETPEEALTWKKVKPMIQWVRARIREADEFQHWAYVRALRESEQLEVSQNVATQS